MPKGVYVRILAPVADRFWKKVNKMGPIQSHTPHLGRCWVWTGAPHNFGYGQLFLGPEQGKKIYAHRLSWLLADRRITHRKLVLHKCDFRRCVRPSHLFLGTHADNTTDMIKKGRYKNAPAE